MMWKKRPLAALALSLALLLPTPAQGAEAPAIHAEAAILMEAETGQILYEKNAHRQMQPASLTKIMTCLLAIEAGNPEQQVTVTPQALDLMEDAAAIGLQEGERLPLRELLYAAMLPSANDAANAVAIHIAGSEAAFARQMNRRAEALGLTDTRFVNASGLPVQGHSTTAYDLAEITREALRYPSFLDYAGRPSYFIRPGPENRGYSFSHLNRLLLPGSGYFDARAIAGKTGWTVPAGHCLMTVAEQDGVRLIAIILRAEGDGTMGGPYPDTKALLDYGFGSFRRVELPLPAEGFLGRIQESEYYLTPVGTTVGLMVPAELPREGLTVQLVGTAEGEEGRFWGEAALRNAAGEVLWQGGRIPLTGELLLGDLLGPSAVAYLPQVAKEVPRLPLMEFGAAAVVAALVGLWRLLARRGGKEPAGGPSAERVTQRPGAIK
ncbi:MAG: D-alanyl-D-alanine carboxypeptidase [Angelakisella sp.]|jgi:D-alanyl-D-alanine carboxypeptidase|nr:D-alanyl-D-alanine carboxypeptidase [Angelakisella sp.]